MKETIVRALHSGAYQSLFEKLYGEAAPLAPARYEAAINAFTDLYGDGELLLFSAPGRCEIGGNHTDHQNGCVLAAAVSVDMLAVARKTDRKEIRITSRGYAPFTLSLCDLALNEAEFGTTKALVRGVLAGLFARGYRIGGFDAYIDGGVPAGSGLSSSAAFEVLIGTVLSGLYNEGNVDYKTLAMIGQEAENKHFGKPSGLLDQMASACGGLVFIDFFDKKKPYVEALSADLSSLGYCLAVVNTGGSHADLTNEYAAIPCEMKQVSSYFGKENLSEVSEEEFLRELPSLRGKLSDRALLRAMHFFRETVRAKEEAAFLSRGDIEGFLCLVKQSGDSSFKYLQNLYAPQNPCEQGLPLALALTEALLSGVGACRVHGGGFAGTVEVFLPLSMKEAYKGAIEAVFGEGSCLFLSVRPYGGIQILPQ